MEQGDSAAVARYGERAVHVDVTEIKNWETLAIQSFVDYVGEERVREEQVESARGEAEEKERRTTLCHVFDYVANNEPPASFNALLFRL